MTARALAMLRRGQIRAALLLSALLVLSACAPVPVAVQRTSLPSAWTPSPSFGERRPNFIIIHHTTNATAERALDTLTDPERELSAHYLIARDGRLVQLVDERMRAWHAGASYWGGNTDLNSASIGIELDNTGAEPYAEAQIVTLLSLLADLRQRYKIPAANVLGHAAIAPRRKVDPSHHFPWQRLAGQGFGLWCDSPASASTATATSARASAAPSFPVDSIERSSAILLQAIGYDVSDLSSAIAAYRRHFMGDPNNQAATTDLDDAERVLALCLARQRKG